ncbi:MAG: ABC transporter ATP-binding protein [Acidobacteria bacterium]|nr:ABC transporter ATP-binding protein [Acidobacteriota bacterium]
MLANVRNLSKQFGRNAVLSDVSFSVREGEVLGLIGPNGSGKTTLFECLAGLLPCDSGAVDFRGEPLKPARRKEALFYMPDGIRPWPDQTVAWALDFFARMWRRPAGDTAQAWGLAPLARSRIGALSKGELKRTLLALALLTPQPLLLLDEPFDGLDFRQTREAMALLRGRPLDEGRTLLVSIHQLTDAARVSDRLVLLSRGRVVAEGSPAELHPLEEVFLALT